MTQDKKSGQSGEQIQDMVDTIWNELNKGGKKVKDERDQGHFQEEESEFHF